jgi:hypothetical protein
VGWSFCFSIWVVLGCSSRICGASSGGGGGFGSILVVGCGLGVGGELFRFGFDGGGRRFGLSFLSCFVAFPAWWGAALLLRSWCCLGGGCC